MTIGKWLVQSMSKLHAAGVDSPRRDSLVLLEDVMQKNRAWIVAHPEYDLPPPTLKRVNRLVARRLEREPLAYIRGKAWFYGRFFKVSPEVMIPRPESESFIDLLKKIRPQWIIDIGTGSGCLAITAKLELPQADVAATDISEPTLEVAQENAKNFEAQITFTKTNLLESLDPLQKPPVSAVIANLPYVPAGLVTSPEIEAEPPSALFAGPDGLAAYKRFWRELALLRQKPQHVLSESLESQHEALQKLASTADYSLQETDGLVQLFKNSSSAPHPTSG